MTYRPATPADRPAMIALLITAGLLADDLPADVSLFVLAEAEDGQLVGVAGVDSMGQTGLLRSVAVLPKYRDQHIGSELVEQVLQLARHRLVTTLYLLTTTAEGYFSRLGFAPISRANVPDQIAQTRQFANLCPASAVVMKREI